MKINKYIEKPGEYEVKIKYGKEGEEKDYVGVVNAKERGVYKIGILVEHLVKATKGKVVVRAVVSTGARVELSGRVVINKVAQQTDSFLELRVLLLDDDSTASVDPQLEILANEVKAGHAASVGKIDEEQIKYIKSRGVSEKQARELIVEGFIKGE
ncbi:MAG: SufD family Fe-S cluster assembly protein [bacterium]